MAVMISGVVDPAVMFMLGTAIALMINYPQLRACSAPASTRTPRRR